MTIYFSELYQCPQVDFHSRIKRMTGGSTIAPGDHPSFVFITEKSTVNCGGILIRSNMVVTAAHCFFDVNNEDECQEMKHRTIYAIRGTNKNDRSEITHVFRHSEFNVVANNANLYSHDIAVALLRDPIDISSHPICLQNGLIPAPSDICWGLGNGNLDNTKIQDAEPHVSKLEVGQCTKTGHRRQSYTNSRILCASKGPNEGDSGGPVVCSRSGQYYLAGIMAQAYTNTKQTIFTNMMNDSLCAEWVLIKLNESVSALKSTCSQLQFGRK
ncbi:transmembrane protease serine 13-like isoform X1 [Styela clava]